MMSTCVLSKTRFSCSSTTIHIVSPEITTTSKHVYSRHGLTEGSVHIQTSSARSGSNSRCTRLRLKASTPVAADSSCGTSRRKAW